MVERFGLGCISPNYFVNPESHGKILKLKMNEEFEELDDDVDAKILVYEDRLNGWFLKFAEDLIKVEDSEFVVLMICIGYFEGNQQFRDGKSSKFESTIALEKALRRVFPEIKEEIVNLIIDGARHGIFHDGMTKRDIWVRYSSPVPFFETKINGNLWLTLNPKLILEKIREDFKEYIQLLKDKTNKKDREKFEKHYIERYGKHHVRTKES